MAAPLVDISARLDALCRDLCAKVPALAHIRPDALLFCIARSRAEGTHGVYARIAPLRFAAGEVEQTRQRGRHLETYRMPALQHRGQDILYLITLMMPRFLRLSLEQKLTTVIHELYHISEACDGDIRRFAGRNFAHGASRRAYNQHIRQLLEGYLRTDPDPALLAGIDLSERDWLAQGFRLTGLTLSIPRARLVARKRH